jgi:ubiquinone/menaquinone biosynthesis C-methylase UbiE
MGKPNLFIRFLRFFFTHLYTTIAWSYDYVAWFVSFGQWNSWVLTASQHVKVGPVLELGYGPGHLLLYGAKQGWSGAGIDVSPQMAVIASRRLTRSGHAQRAVLGRAQELPLSGYAFQHVLSTFPDQYIASDEALAEIHRVLRRGGSLVITAMAEITGSAIFDRLASWLFRITGQTGPIPHTWRDQLLQAGFMPEIKTVQLPRSRVTLIIGTKS